MRFQEVSPELGLPRATINELLQDHEGFLWVATWSGLYRYDGYQLKVFQQDLTNANGLDCHKITSLYEDHNNNLWVCSRNGGLFRYNREHEVFEDYKFPGTDPYGMPNNNLWSVIEDRQGRLWVGTEAGLHAVDLEKKELVPIQGVSDFTYSIAETADGAFWLGTENGLIRVAGLNPQTRSAASVKRFSLVPENLDKAAFGSQSHNYVYRVVASVWDSHALWVGTKAGLKRIDWTQYKLGNLPVKHYQHQDDDPSSLSNNFVVRIKEYQTSTGWEIWVATFNGLNRFNPVTEKFKVFRAEFGNPNSLGNNNIRALYIDRTGLLWIGTDRGAFMLNLKAKPFQTILSNNNSLTRNFVVSVMEENAAHDKLWVATLGGGLNAISFDAQGLITDKLKRITFQLPKSPQLVDFVSAISADGLGNLWLGTLGAGLIKVPEKMLLSEGSVQNFTQFTEAQGDLNDDHIMYLTKDAAHRTWMGFWDGGIGCIAPGETKVSIFDKTSSDYDLHAFPNVALLSDVSGVDSLFWVGTRGGGLLQLRYDGASKKLIQLGFYKHNAHQPGSISSNFINALFRDHQGQIWVGTENGLNVFDPKTRTFRVFLTKDGLPDNIIQSIEEDKSGNIWISTNQGLASISLNGENLKVDNFYRGDGIQDNFFFGTSSCSTTFGQLVFGGVNGLTFFRPENIRKDSVAPKVEIIGLRLFNQPVAIGQEVLNKVVLPHRIHSGDTISLTYRHNVISIEFVGLHFTQPNANKYAYKLEGFDEDWVYTDAGQRLAHYTNLPYQTYTFQVKAANSDGVWSEVPAVMTLIVTPPFWLTGWAYFLYLLLFVGLLILVRYITLTQANLQNNLELERIEREKVEEVSRLKLQFFTNISHELRTPLTLILSPLEDLIKEKVGEKPVRETFARMYRNGTRLLNLINQLLDLRKSDSGLMKLKVAEGNIIKFVNEIVIAFQSMAAHDHIELEFVPEKDPILVWYDRDQMEKVLFNLLSNAMKFTPKSGQVSVRVGEKDGWVYLSVQDTGVGIAEEDLKHIFDRFYQADNQHLKPGGGTGIGLALSMNLVDAHHGRLEATSEPGKGSQFTVWLQTGEGHFTPEEKIPNFRHSEHASYFLLPEDAGPSGAVAGEEVSSTSSINPEHQPLILLVEDNPDIRTYVREQLLDTYRVIEAADGVKGLEMAKRESPDLIISDIAMPKMDGIELCRRVKTDIETSHMPVILLTARTSLIYKIDGLETGADDYITKPFNMTLLKLRVRNLIKSREQLRDRFGKSMELNPSAVVVTSLDETFLKKVIASVEAHVDDPAFSVEQLADDLAMSRMQVYRKLKAITGQTPNHVIRSIRLKRAAQLLNTGQFTIAEVTYQVGFQDLKYFRERFKEEFGLTPSEYTAGNQPEEENLK